MAGSLIKIDEFTVSSAVASVTLGGGSSGSSGLNASIDSTYDVYMVRINNVLPATDFVNFRLRFTVSGSADISSNYDRAFKNLRADTTFGNTGSTDADHINIGGLGTTGQEMSNAILYLFNFNNASEYSFCTLEATTRNDQSHLRGFQGGALLTVAQATDGVNFSMDSGNIASGTFTLYGLKK